MCLGVWGCVSRSVGGVAESGSVRLEVCESVWLGFG